MNIHEYQAKDLLRQYGVAVLNGKMATTPEAAQAVAEELGGQLCVVKAQIHAGGRGKAGGVKLAKTPQEARDIAAGLLGKNLVTHQTGPEGKEVQKVFVEQGCAIAKEFYLGMVLDRATSRVTVMASSEGGVEIEEVAARSPEKILREAVDPALGVGDFSGPKNRLRSGPAQGSDSGKRLRLSEPCTGPSSKPTPHWSRSTTWS